MYRESEFVKKSKFPLRWDYCAWRGGESGSFQSHFLGLRPPSWIDRVGTRVALSNWLAITHHNFVALCCLNWCVAGRTSRLWCSVSPAEFY
jgi:hypothetical protein